MTSLMTWLLLVLLSLATCLPTEDEYQYQYPEDYPDDELMEEEIVSLDKPDFVSVGGLIVVHEGGKVVMPCQVNALGGRQTVWSKVPGAAAAEDQLSVGSVKLSANPRMRLYSLSDEGGTIITITPTTITDSGTYTCMIADNRLDQRLVFTLQVVSSLQEDDLSKSGAGRTWLERLAAALQSFCSEYFSQ
eukprot:TRINITY_DN11730_c0_g1_i1.p1 TRINITY_DN11730_c0_g1~~TRINITY_DN11730_c0_g1_i1.p1  ORF type:complete len:190 (+),score=70.84 TRINITY_DN11730_c0_g1_i1:64-633(+)